MSIAVSGNPMPSVSDKFIESRFKLGQTYYNATEYRSAKASLVIAAEKGHVEAMYLLGLIYVKGLGTEPDEEKGIELLKSAANQDCVGAIRELAILYKDRIQKWSDLELRSRAMGLFQKAIENGDEISKDHLRALQEQAPAIIQLRCKELFPGPPHDWENRRA